MRRSPVVLYILPLTVAVLLVSCSSSDLQTTVCPTPSPLVSTPSLISSSLIPTPPPPAPTMTSALPPLPAPTSPMPTPAVPSPTAVFDGLVVSLSDRAFDPGGEIAERHGFLRENISPELTWHGLPDGTRSLALLLRDRDFPFFHWVVYNISPSVTGLPEGASQQSQLPDGVLQGTSTNGRVGYVGPYPPPGDVHHYVFTLYALDTPLDLAPGATGEQVLAAMESHILAKGEAAGTYMGVNP